MAKNEKKSQIILGIYPDLKGEFLGRKALKEKIDSSKENFELTDSALKNYYNSIMSNLTMAMNDISNLNGDVNI